MQVPRQQGNTSPSSGSSNEAGAIAAAGAVPGSAQDEYLRSGRDPYRLDGVSAGTRPATADGEGVYFDEGQPSFGEQEGRGYGEGAYGQYAQPQQQDYAPAPHVDRDFASAEPTQGSAGIERHDSTYGSWMAPAAAGVGAAGVGAAGYAAYQDRGPDDAEAPAQHETVPKAPWEAPAPAPETYRPSGFAAATTTEATTPQPSSTTDTARPTSTPEAQPLGGLESEGAHETGAVFPRVVRHDTEMSVSRLHVPGEYPRSGTIE